MTTRTARVLGGLLLSAALAATTSLGQPPAGGVKLEDVSYADLGKFVRAQGGKVVLVDFWADF